MSLKSLIENQKIIIDEHKRATGEIKKWDSDDDIHIDKETQYKIEGKLQQVRIKIPINSHRKISVEAKSKINEIPRKLKKEIIKAFENKKKRESFIQDLVEILKNYESTISNLDKVKDAMTRIAKHFELTSWIEEEIKNIIGSTIAARLYKDDENNEYYIIMNNKKIELGQISTSWKEVLKLNGIENQ